MASGYAAAQVLSQVCIYLFARTAALWSVHGPHLTLAFAPSTFPTSTRQLHDVVLKLSDIKDAQKSAILHKMAEVDKALLDGADEYLQLMDLAADIMQTLTGASKKKQ